MQKTTFRILIIHNKYRYAGGEDSVMQNEVRLLESHGHHVVLYQKDNSELDYYPLLDKLRLPLRTLYSISSAKDIRTIIKQEQIDIVHIHNTLPLISFSAYYAAKQCDCALVQTLHNFRLLCPNGLFYRDNVICKDCLKSLSCSVKHSCYRNSKVQSMLVALMLLFHRLIGTFRLPDAYIALTEFNQSVFAPLLDKNRLFIKPNFTEPADFVPQDYNFKSREYFIYLSRIERSKGIFLLLDAFRNLPDTPLLIVGTGPDDEAVQAYINKHCMKNVRFLGFTPHNEALSFLYHAKALIFPTQLYEGFPVVLAESFSLGTPVIGSNIGNTASIVEDGQTGLLFKHDSTEDLILKIKQLNTPSFPYSTMEENCYTTYKQHYTPDKNYDCLLSIYQAALSHHSLRS